ncbi:MAG: hypothetical protein NWQ37_01980 [Marivita lacus]|nr:hypothetical protein [Marivita lacus]
MSRTFIAAVLAVSTTIAAFSAMPARAASEEDIAKLLAGAATVFIIGKAIQNSRDRDRPDKEVRHYTPDDRFGYVTKPVPTYERPIPKVVPREGRPRQGDVLPADCVRRIEGGRVERVVMSRCLERSNISTRSLPKACRMIVQTRRGEAKAYALPCLRHRGYTLARH